MRSDTTPQHFDVAIVGGRCVLPSATSPDQLEVQTVDLGISSGRIAAIAPSGTLLGKAAETVDAHNLHVLPGAIDSQVHFRDPGLTHKEDLESGTRGAILGGVTTIFDMPNTKPPTISREALQEKLQLASGRCWTDYAFFIGATGANISELATLETLPGCCGVKIFMGSSTGTLLVDDDASLREILRNGRRRVAVHAEDEARLIERKSMVTGSGDVRLHPQWRDELVALRATQRLVKIARETGRKVHVLHVTTAEEMDFLRDVRSQDRGEMITVETTPQHLTLAAPECYERLGTLAQMNPPIREARHREALWRAVVDGTVTVLGSDHAPHTREEKQKPYPESPSGMTGVQTMLPLMLHHANQGRLTLLRVVDLLATAPARIYGIAGKGAIKLGNDADLAIVDMKAKREVTDSWIASRSGWTPFAGMQLSAWVTATLRNGKVVMRDGELLTAPTGKPVEFSK